MSNQPLSLREQLVELNDSQWQLLERMLLAVLPERPGNELIQQSLQNGRPQQAASYNGFAAAIDQATDSIRKALSK